MTKELAMEVRDKLRGYLIKDISNSDSFITQLYYYLKPSTGILCKDNIVVESNDVYRVKVSPNTYISSLVVNSIILNTINIFIVNNIVELDLNETLKVCDITVNKNLYKVFELEYNNEKEFCFII